jgi:hypothetical protein
LYEGSVSFDIKDATSHNWVKTDSSQSTCFQIPLGIDHVGAGASGLFFPNPTQGIIKFKTETTGTFLIFNALREKVAEFFVPDDLSGKEVAWNLSDFPTGIYYCIHGTRQYKIVLLK